MKRILCLSLLLMFALSLGACSDDSNSIGEATSNWRMFTPNDKIKVEEFSDPDIPEISIYISRADRGGIKGAVGLAEDKSNASVDAILTGVFNGTVPDVVIKNNGKEVFKQSQSLVLKSMSIKRFYDPENNSVVYMAHSREIIAGGYKSSVAAVWLGPKKATTPKE